MINCKFQSLELVRNLVRYSTKRAASPHQMIKISSMYLYHDKTSHRYMEGSSQDTCRSHPPRYRLVGRGAIGAHGHTLHLEGVGAVKTKNIIGQNEADQPQIDGIVPLSNLFGPRIN